MQAKTEAFSIAGKACLPATYKKTANWLAAFMLEGLTKQSLI